MAKRAASPKLTPYDRVAIRLACALVDAPEADVIAPERGSVRAAYARQLAVMLMREAPDEPSFGRIGKRLSDRDQTTVRASVLAIEADREDADIHRMIARLETIIPKILALHEEIQARAEGFRGGAARDSATN